MLVANINTGGTDAKPGVLKAVARAGSDVDIQWSGIIRMHNGPVLTVSTIPLFYVLPALC
jgi:hypothetical protein